MINYDHVTKENINKHSPNFQINFQIEFLDAPFLAKCH